ncbi:hypothetical protein QBC44DRAFT_99296 [Cladorrhinum sp. PSN332]|nr:hypothetical protein QBC44DRAFT_99296 [Cladorrhinum sp. PSN332]
MRPLPLTLWALLTAQIEALENQQSQSPTAIRKMPPDDPGAKFHPHYVAFAPQQESQQLSPALLARQLTPPSNSSSSSDFRPPFALLNTSPNPSFDLFRRSALQKKQWSCPSGTNSCAPIGYPNSCCTASETCVAIQDTGLGPVGCCPAGTTCNGSVGGCGSGSPCGSSVGGGCCIPGFICAGVGCVQAPPSAPPPPPPPPQTTTSTTTPSPVITTPSTVLESTAASSNQDPNAPVRPTSSTASVNTTPPPAEPTEQPEEFCPTGYYPCLASAGGGCCQTGRDCQVTSCPPVSLTTVVDGGDGGVTVVAPGRAAPPQFEGGGKSCAGGWFECRSEIGGGCCPSGYRCGEVSCAVEVDGGAGETAAVAKVLPGESEGHKTGRSGWLVGGLMGVGLMGMVMV